MNTSRCTRHPATNRELERMIEPLVNYICAAEQPRAALLSALAALRDEVKQTHQSAISHLDTFAGKCRP